MSVPPGRKRPYRSLSATLDRARTRIPARPATPPLDQHHGARGGFRAGIISALQGERRSRVPWLAVGESISGGEDRALVVERTAPGRVPQQTLVRSVCGRSASSIRSLQEGIRQVDAAEVGAFAIANLRSAPYSVENSRSYDQKCIAQVRE